jgi:hypothetical protein
MSLGAHTKGAFWCEFVEGEVKVNLRKGGEAKRRQQELIEGLQTLLTDWNLGAPPACL